MPQTRQRSKDVRDKAKQRKIRKRDQVNNRVINKRKYYGIGVEIEEYQDTMEDVVDYDKLDTLVTAAIPERNEESVITESIIEDILAQITDPKEFFDAKVIAELGGVLERSFEKGSKRAYDSDGDQIDVDEVSEDRAMSQLMRDQEEYFGNMAEDVRDKIRDTLNDGLDKGQAVDEVRDNLQDEVDSFTKQRAETTARSECIKASSRGTEQAMQEAGVEEVIWLATLDDRTCETCQDLHESKWEMSDGDRPMPVEDTHPNCRCTIVADTRS